jgi:hypothetical protein
VGYDQGLKRQLDPGNARTLTLLPPFSYTEPLNGRHHRTRVVQCTVFKIGHAREFLQKVGQLGHAVTSQMTAVTRT